MKKFLMVLLAVMLLFTVAACSNNEGNGNDEDEVVVVDDEGDETEYVRGTITGNTYYSAYTGLKVTLPDDYIFFTDEQMKQIAGIGQEYLGSDIDDSGIIYEFLASNSDPSNTTSLNVVSEKVNFTISDALLVQVIENTKPQLESQYEAYSYEYLSDLSSDVSGKVLSGMSYSMVVEGSALYYYQYFFCEGDVLSTLTITVDSQLSEDGLNELLGYISFE